MSKQCCSAEFGRKLGLNSCHLKKKHQLNKLTFSKEINCNCLLLKSSCVSVAWQFQFFNGLLWSQGHEYPVWQIGFLKKITLKINLIKIKGLRVLLIFLLSPSFCIFSFFFFLLLRVSAFVGDIGNMNILTYQRFQMKAENSKGLKMKGSEVRPTKHFKLQSFIIHFITQFYDFWMDEVRNNQLLQPEVSPNPQPGTHTAPSTCKLPASTQQRSLHFAAPLNSSFIT